MNRHHDRSNDQLNGLNNMIATVGSNLDSQVQTIGKNLADKIDNVADSVKVCSSKLDKNENVIESGMQAGFNNLVESAQKWMTPTNTPVANQHRSLRRNLLASNMVSNKYETLKSRR